MPLTPGTTLGHYRLASLIGEGGMGEVYRATDTRLNREIALKVLGADVARDAERLARFEREARLASSLNHRSIVTIHDVGRERDTSFIAMELLDGHTLRKDLTGRPLPLKKLASIGARIADGLAAAHRAGIVHRDLKPDNIMLTAGGEPKIVDFGLAKLTAAFDDGASTRLSANTGEGAVLGTVSYMSPEQASGQPVDFRSDQFSFGLVLFEMATGRHPFARESAPETLAAIISETHVSAASLNPKVPESLGWILDRCLEKDPAARYGSTEDLARDLARVVDHLSSPAAAVSAKAPQRSPWVWPAVAALVIAVAMGRYAARGVVSAPAPASAHPIRLAIVPEFGWQMDLAASAPVAIAPSGDRLAFVATRAGNRRLFVRALSGFTSRMLDGTEGAELPFFSPDGAWIGFFAGDQLKKVSVADGTVATLAPAANGRGGYWGAGDSIIFAQGPSTGLMRISASGGAVTPATTLAEGEISHRNPQLLDDGKTLLFTIVMASGDSPSVAAIRLDTGERMILLEDASHGRAIPGGRILYARNDGLTYTKTFDESTLAVSGTPQAVSDDLGESQVTDIWNFAVAANGTLAYLPMGRSARQRRELMLVNRQGQVKPIATDTADFLFPSVSPDGTRVGVNLRDETGLGLWIVSMDSGQRSQLRQDALSAAVWHPDGQSVATNVLGAGLFIIRTDGSREHRLGDHTYISPTAWTNDGQSLIIHRNMRVRDDPLNRLWVVTADGARATPIARQPGVQLGGRLSPDNRWMAFYTQGSVFATPFPSGGPTTLIAKGGTQPVWSRDGRELFYRIGGKMMAVPIGGADALAAGQAVELFDNPGFLLSSPGYPTYDVTPDGRFVMIKAENEDASRNQVNVVINWAASLARPQ